MEKVNDINDLVREICLYTWRHCQLAEMPKEMGEAAIAMALDVYPDLVSQIEQDEKQSTQ